jgi:prevent-host-death family protein
LAAAEPMIASTHEAKTQLSKLVERALAGEEAIVARNGVPAGRLVPVEAMPARRVFGQWKGLVEESHDAFTPEA